MSLQTRVRTDEYARRLRKRLAELLKLYDIHFVALRDAAGAVDVASVRS